MARPKKAPADPTVTNIVPGLDITLHDGSHLLFGDAATVPEYLASILRERGQVK